MNPADILRDEGAPLRRPEATSPATELAKIRHYKQAHNNQTTHNRYIRAVNRMWRTRYIHIHEREQREF